MKLSKGRRSLSGAALVELAVVVGVLAVLLASAVLYIRQYRDLERRTSLALQMQAVIAGQFQTAITTDPNGDPSLMPSPIIHGILINTAIIIGPNSSGIPLSGPDLEKQGITFIGKLDREQYKAAGTVSYDIAYNMIEGSAEQDMPSATMYGSYHGAEAENCFKQKILAGGAPADFYQMAYVPKDVHRSGKDCMVIAAKAPAEGQKVEVDLRIITNPLLLGPPGSESINY